MNLFIDFLNIDNIKLIKKGIYLDKILSTYEKKVLVYMIDDYQIIKKIQTKFQKFDLSEIELITIINFLKEIAE